ncbi:MAG TPA: RDD family protein [Nitrososphaerales archaeon]|nr:RDD family protein [Nitrososphaerales archaeon]
MSNPDLAFCAKCGKELPMNATFCPACGTPVGTSGSTATSGSTSTSSQSMGMSGSGLDTLSKDSKAQQYWFQRLIAFVIDAIIVNVVLYIIAIFVFSALFFGGVGYYAFFFGGFTFVSGFLLVLYFPFLESMRGASIGKGFFKLKVVNKGGTNPTFMEAFIRNISKIFWLLLLLDVIGGLVMSKGVQQKYTDTMAGTMVVAA